ncbi:MAG TPA: RsmB/NOP family class I SAM-dependent RNA methyltransferase, partial [Bryobacteraceae bacterium]
SVPAWILERWDRQYGAEIAEGIARAALVPAEPFVRVAGRVPCGVTLAPTEIEGAYRVVGGDPAGLRMQDIGSQSIVPLLGLQPGQSFLDLCAAPGNKTAQALESGVRAVACDLHLSRLEHMRELDCSLVALDGTLALPFREPFERILVDAPCSGTGTLARNPEIKWRLKPEDFDDLHSRQARLLRNALERLTPGGRLVYSTCSLEREENEAVLAECGGRVLECRHRLPGRDAGDGFFAAVLTSG